jgi:hypothetical protein
MSYFEKLVAGNAVEPLLLGHFFVVREIEAHEEFYRARVGGLVFRLVGPFRFCALRAFGGRFGLGVFFRLVGGLGFGCSFGRFGGYFVTAIKFDLELFVEAEGLLPSFQFMAGLLRFFLVGELKNHVSVGHATSLPVGITASQETLCRDGIGKLQTRDIFSQRSAA